MNKNETGFHITTKNAINTLQPHPKTAYLTELAEEKKRSFQRKGLLAVATSAVLGLAAFFSFGKKGNDTTRPDTPASSKIQKTETAKRPATPLYETLAATQTNVLDNAATVLPPNPFNYYINQLSKVLPKDVSPDTIQAYASAMINLTTNPKTQQVVLFSSKTLLKQMVALFEAMPTNHLKDLAEGKLDTGYFSYDRITQEVVQNPENIRDIIQRTFEVTQAYALHRQCQPPIKENAGNCLFLYWDNGQPTVGIGLHINANPSLRGLRYKNSPKVQQILGTHAQDKYITLSSDQMRRLTQYVKNNLFNKSASIHQKELGLNIHPEDVAKLDAVFNQRIAQSIQNVETFLQTKKTSASSVMFGAYHTPVPLEFASVAVDLDFNLGKTKFMDYNKFSTAYANRAWEKAKQECATTQELNQRALHQSDASKSDSKRLAWKEATFNQGIRAVAKQNAERVYAGKNAVR